MNPKIVKLGILGLVAIVTLLMSAARKRDPNAPAGDPLLAMILGWCIPGAGHWVLGSRGKAVFFFFMIMATFAAGVWLADCRNVKYDDNEFYWVGQLGCGAILVIANVFVGYAPHGKMPIEWYEIGLLYICVAGMLNVVLLLNLFNPPPKPQAAAKEAA